MSQKTMVIKSPLEIVCNPDGKGITRHPWRTVLDGTPAAVSLDGYRMLVVFGESEFPDAPQNYAATFIKHMIPSITIGQRVSLKALLQLCGDPWPTCPHCGTFCPTCLDAGDRQRSLCSYAGVVFDPKLLRDVLAMLEGDVVLVGATTNMFQVWSEQWHFYLMAWAFTQGHMDRSKKVETIVEVPDAPGSMPSV